MKQFAQLYNDLDQTNSTNEKVALLADYFQHAPAVDCVWALALLSGRRPKRTVATAQLKLWACQLSGTDEWLFEESYAIVGDLAETITLILPPTESNNNESLTYWVNYIRALGSLTDEEKRQQVFDAWNKLGLGERFTFNKLITGGFRVGVSQTLVCKAIAKFTGVSQNVIAHRLMGKWEPGTVTFDELILQEGGSDDITKPYPFCLAYPIDVELPELGNATDWQAEWKWDGIRGQIIKRKGEFFIWSRGEELVTDKFPELHELCKDLPDGTVLDGEIMPFKDGKPLTFNQLQTRIGRKNVTKKALADAPVSFFSYDLLEWQGEDLRVQPLVERREKLELLVKELNHDKLLLSEAMNFASWDELKAIHQHSRDVLSEGLMLKHKQSQYEVGRKKGLWWKWKVDPYSIDAVLIYAQTGHGRRANLYTDYTFALWQGDLLVPFAKAYSGLTNEEIMQVDAIIRQTTKERFGPVRSVNPTMVFELGFEGINASPRHKSGVAVRFPRILRWRNDKKIEDANTLDDLKALINHPE